MNESTTKATKQFTGCANLAAIGLKLRQLDLFGPIRQAVHQEIDSFHFFVGPY